MNRQYSLIILFFLLSCKSSYDVDKVYYKDSVSLIDNSVSLNFSTPLKINFYGSLMYDDKNYKVSGIIKIKDYNNYQIFLSSRTLGIEIARMEFYGDSIFFVNKLKKVTTLSKIDDLPYLKGFKLDSDRIIRILTGRTFYGLDYNLNLDTNIFKYNFYSYTGIIELYNFGYLKSHSITVGSSKINMIYREYFKKFRLPTDINGDIFTNNTNVIFKLKYSTISNLKTDFKHLYNLN